MATQAASYDVIDSLRAKATGDSDFISLLEASLAEAKSEASSGLDKDLFAALDWPLNLEGYIDFLFGFARWRPQQSDAVAWKSDPDHPEKESSQEVYDRLCHFYWLIDQKVGPDGIRLQNIPWFSEWLISYADVWGSFLDTPESFDEKILASFQNDSPKFRVEDSMIDGRPNAPSGWLTFNQFFARELNPGLRPISEPGNNTTVVCPADCTFKQTYPIGPDSTIDLGPESTDKHVTFKQTHRVGNVAELLKDSPYANDFAGGTFVHYFLGPYSYHRFHTPVAGEVLECRAIPGEVYLAVNLAGQQFDAPDDASDGYQFVQARGLITIDTKGSAAGDIGLVAVIPVGMCQVSSVNMTHAVGAQTRKGDEFGYFLFGGSDIIVLFQEGANPQIDTGGDYRHYGTPIATCDLRSS